MFSVLPQDSRCSRTRPREAMTDGGRKAAKMREIPESRSEGGVRGVLRVADKERERESPSFYWDKSGTRHWLFQFHVLLVLIVIVDVSSVCSRCRAEQRRRPVMNDIVLALYFHV